MARNIDSRLAAKAGFFAFLTLSVLALSACHRSRPRQEIANAWEWQGQLAAPATIQIRNTVGPITVEPSADNTVSVIASTSWTRGDPQRDIQFRAVSAGTVVTICAIWTRGECSATDYGTRESRGISFRQTNRTDARVSFTLKVPAGVRVDAYTVSGDVTVRAAAPVKARTIDGDILVGTSIGPVDAETINGDVDARMTTLAEGAGPVRAVTKNGDAVAYVPEIANGRIDASTINGDVGSDFGQFPVSTQRVGRKLETTLGAGARNYSVQSLNGSAWLRLINADGSVRASGSTTTTEGPAASSAAVRPIPPP